MTTETEILQYLHYHPLSKRMEIGHAVTTEISERTLKRVIADCVETVSYTHLSRVLQGEVTLLRHHHHRQRLGDFGTR